MIYPIFPEYKLSEGGREHDNFKFVFKSTVRVLREGLWYDVNCFEEYIFSKHDLYTQGIDAARDRVFKSFLHKCVNVLTLWKVDERYLSEKQSHHDQIIAEMTKLKQEHEHRH